MTITAANLTKAAGAAAAVAGAIFIAVQVDHPASDSFTTETSQWVARGTAKVLMTVLALAGITGMYLRQVRRTGLLGLVGYLVLAAGYLAMLSVEVISVTVLPALSDTQPDFVDDVVSAAVGGATTGDIGAVQTLLSLAGAGYIVGGLVFGIALFRSGVLARWAAALLSVGTTGTAALAVLPESFNRPLAVPVGVALVGLGVSLWRHHQELPVRTAASSVVAEPAVR